MWDKSPTCQSRARFRSPTQLCWNLSFLRWCVRMRFFLSIALLMLMVSSAPSAEPEREPFDDAIARGLDYLAKEQNTDGSWPAYRIPDPAVTALCVMAYLSSGHVPGEGPYGK